MKLSQKLTEQHIQPFFEEWAEIELQLSNLHSRRSKETAEPLLRGIELYQQLIDHCQDPSGEWRIEPMNAGERLEFVRSNPQSYAAYRQLAELFVEMKKAIARVRIRVKRTEK